MDNKNLNRPVPNDPDRPLTLEQAADWPIKPATMKKDHIKLEFLLPIDRGLSMRWAVHRKVEDDTLGRLDLVFRGGENEPDYFLLSSCHYRSVLADVVPKLLRRLYPGKNAEVRKLCLAIRHLPEE